MGQWADLAIIGADIYTVDAARSWSDAVAVRGDRIIALGDQQVKDVLGPSTRVIEAPGAMVLPGFQDSHLHPPIAGRNRIAVDLTGAEGLDEYLEVIRRYADAHPDAPWIIGGGWAMEYFPGGTPNRADLDRVVPDRPVFLFNRDVHGAWVNTAALKAGGITVDTPDPADGRIERDPATGEPSGTLHEGVAYRFNDEHVPPLTERDWRAAIANAQAHLHSLGITGFQDAWVTPETFAAYRAMDAAGELSARVVGALWWDRYRGLEQIDEFVQRRALGGAGRFHPTTVKIMTDGVLENHTGALLEPYCAAHGHGGDNSGLTYIDADLLAEAVTELDRLGFQVHMHTIGDRAVRNALDAVAAARAANGPSDHRHHLAHIQVVQPTDIPRFRELGVVANFQPYWAQMEPQMSELTLPFLGPDRSAMQYPFGDLLRAGVVLAGGSDWPVTTANPLEEIEVAVTRIDPENRHNAPFLPEQALPLPDAIAAFTAGAAYVNHDADGGTIRVGSRADLAVINRSLFADEPIADAHVTHTIAAGTVVFDAADKE